MFPTLKLRLVLVERWQGLRFIFRTDQPFEKNRQLRSPDSSRRRMRIRTTSSTIGHIIARHVTYPINFRQYAVVAWKTRVSPTSLPFSPPPLPSPPLLPFQPSILKCKSHGAAQYANATIVVSDNICLTER